MAVDQKFLKSVDFGSLAADTDSGAASAVLGLLALHTEKLKSEREKSWKRWRLYSVFGEYNLLRRMRVLQDECD